MSSEDRPRHTLWSILHRAPRAGFEIWRSEYIYEVAGHEVDVTAWLSRQGDRFICQMVYFGMVLRTDLLTDPIDIVHWFGLSGRATRQAWYLYGAENIRIREAPAAELELEVEEE